ncbi:MAG TPA: ABC transporter permease [Streptosporangiaceae bacterium]|jgi:ABC-2 type transport system permease protein
MKFARDTWLVFQRQGLLTLRAPRWLLAFSLAQPVTYLVLFAPMLRLALRHEGITSYAGAYRVYVPGLLTVMAILGGLYSGFGLLADMRSGVVERARVTPVSRPALILGRALQEVATLLVQALIITLLALPFGLRIPLGNLLLAYLLLTLMSVMAVSLGYALTMYVRNEAALGPTINTVSQPVMLLSGVLLPLTLAPLWILSVARWNPFYWATNGMRALFNGLIGANSVWISLIIVVTLAVFAVNWSVRLFARRTA